MPQDNCRWKYALPLLAVASLWISSLAIASRARAEVLDSQPIPIRPTLPVEAALGIHHVWRPAAVRDSATRARRRAEIIARVREQVSHLNGQPPRIQFAEPPELDSLPPAESSPRLPDSLTSGMSSVAVGDLDGDGLPDVAAVEQSDSTLVVRRNLGGGHYAAAVRYALADGAWKLLLADLDGDGRLDVAVLNFSSPTTRQFSVLRNMGGGSFGARTDGDLSFHASDMKTIDLNQDGRADLLFSLYSHNHVDVALGQANWPLATYYSINPAADDDWNPNSSSVAAGDLDGDGNVDLVILFRRGDCYYGSCSSLAFFFGKGGGALEDPVLYQGYNSDAPGAASSVDVRDLDGDRRIDLAVGTNGQAARPAWIRNTGGRHFEAPTITPIDITPWSLQAGVFKPGAAADLIVSDGVTASFLRNRGNGTFEPPQPFALGIPASTVDLNGDGLSDLIIVRGDTTDIRLANGTGGFGAPTTIAGRFATVADFDGDHHLDLAGGLPNGDVGVMHGDGTGAFGPPDDFGPGGGLAADLDGDGRADFAGVQRGAPPDGNDSLVVMWNLGHGFSAPVYYDLGPLHPAPYGDVTWPMVLTTGDFNGDGLLDVAEVKGDGEGGDDGYVTIVSNLGHRSFSAPTPLLNASEDPYAAVVADFDGDGMDDIAVADAMTDYTGRFIVFGGRSDGTIEAVPGTSGMGGYAMEHYAFSITAGDFNHDGRPDVAVGCGYVPYRGATILVVPNITPVGATNAVASLISCDALPNCVSLIWDLSGSHVETVERRTMATDWTAIAHATPDGAGHLRYDDRSIVAGARYGYRLRYGAGAATTAETWIDVPKSLALAIRGAHPNPTHGPLNVTFTLPTADRANLELLDITGRRVRSLDLASPAAGSQSASLDSGTPLPPGLYFVRISQGRARAETRVAVVR